MGRPTPGIADTVDHQRLADDIRDGHARIERAVGVMEHVLNATPEIEQFASGQSEHVHLALAVVIEDPSRIRGEGPHDDPAQRGLAAAALADEAEAFAATNREIDIVHGLDPGARAREERALADHVFLADAADRSEEHTSELQSLMRISYA